MKSFNSVGDYPLSVPLTADDFTELHASRLLLLLRRCGVGGKIEGLTKFAKLDFFVRYPAFFDRVSTQIGTAKKMSDTPIESPMVRFHYGPWDRRYYTLLPFLEARALISVEKKGKAFIFSLTESGKDLATKLEKHPAFAAQVEHMKNVKQLLGAKNGSTLKRLVYQVFDAEVSKKKMGQVIK